MRDDIAHLIAAYRNMCRRDLATMFAGVIVLCLVAYAVALLTPQ